MGFTFNKNSRGYSDFTFRFMRKIVIPATKRIFSPTITNRHNMPLSGPCFIYGNHANYFDPFMLNLEMTKEPTAGVMTRDQFHKTIPRIFMDSIGIVPTSKYVPEPGIVRSVLKMIDQKRMIVIFPEGGRRWDGRPKPFIESTIKLFWKMGIPVHPVQIHGSYLAWPRWADNYRKSSLENRWLDPLYPSDFDTFEAFSETCKSLMDFDEYNPPATVDIKSCSKPASGIGRFLYRCPVSGRSGALFSPDGERVCSRTADINYTMNLRSRLIDTHGEPHSIIDLYDKINSMPMVKDRESVLLKSYGSKVNIINNRHELIHHGKGYVELSADSLLISAASTRETVSFEQIRSLSVEQNHKLTVTTEPGTFQFSIEDGSALQWQKYIRRLIKGEVPVMSL